MQRITLNLVNEYPQFRYPGHRYKTQSLNSGEEFRDEILLPFIKKHENEKIIINLEGAIGFPPSFLEEAFGGCIRKGINKINDIEVVGVDEIEQERIKRYINKAKIYEASNSEQKKIV
jgi:hypothetical protein